MANFILDNTYIIQQSAGTALTWPAPGIKIETIVLYAHDTNARATFQIAAGTPILEWSILSEGSGAYATNSTVSIPMHGVNFQTAWIPTTMTACSAWIHFS